MLVMGLAMLGVYSIKTSSYWSQWVNQSINRLPLNKPWGLIVMGGLSALLLGPCITPPLIAALTWVAAQQDIFLGAFGFYLLGVGLGLPLLLIAVLGQKYLPQSGAWLYDIHRILAWVLFASAIWMLRPIISIEVSYGLWGLWWLSMLWVMWRPNIGYVLSMLALLGALVGWQAFQRPFSSFQQTPISIMSTKEWKNWLAQQDLQNQNIIWVDVTADWCVNCADFSAWLDQKEVRDYILQHKIQVIKLDMTHNTPEDQAWLKHYRLFGPPALLVLDKKGQEIARVVQAKELQQLLFLEKVKP
jgi:thiol:disulfide interchange protein DsbD